jgi:hypothetical protein
MLRMFYTMGVFISEVAARDDGSKNEEDVVVPLSFLGS